MKNLQLNFNLKTVPKSYLSNSKTFPNGPLLAPLLGNNKVATDFLVKANLFNDIFREQCRPTRNDSTLPNNQTIKRQLDFSLLTLTLILLLNLYSYYY